MPAVETRATTEVALQAFRVTASSGRRSTGTAMQDAHRTHFVGPVPGRVRFIGIWSHRDGGAASSAWPGPPCQRSAKACRRLSHTRRRCAGCQVRFHPTARPTDVPSPRRTVGRAQAVRPSPLAAGCPSILPGCRQRPPQLHALGRPHHRQVAVARSDNHRRGADERGGRAGCLRQGRQASGNGVRRHRAGRKGKGSQQAHQKRPTPKPSCRVARDQAGQPAFGPSSWSVLLNANLASAPCRGPGLKGLAETKPVPSTAALASQGHGEARRQARPVASSSPAPAAVRAAPAPPCRSARPAGSRGGAAGRCG